MVNSGTILSLTLLLDDWQGSLTTFKGFTSTRPDQEFENITWPEVCNVLCPDKPDIIEDKQLSQYFIPCQLKEAQLVGNTRKAAIENDQPTTGKMRSKHHVTEAAMLVMDVDGMCETDFIVGKNKIAHDGLTFFAYTTHSHGSPDKPGMRVRVVIPVDRPLTLEEYAIAWHGFDQLYWQGEAGKADASGAKLYQQQGTWCCHPSRVDQAQSWRNEGGVASADALIEIGRAYVDRQSTKEISAKQPDGIKTGRIVHSEPQSQGLAKLKALLEHIDPDCGYENWLQVLMAIFHETGGSEEGLKLAITWSSKGKKYKGSQEIKAKWCSFQLDTNNPITIGTLKKMVSDSGKDLNAICRMAELGFKNLGIELQVIKPSELSKEESKSGSNNNKTPGNELATAIGYPTVPPSDAEVIALLAAMSPMEYDRIRIDKAKEMGVQVKTLDVEVRKARNEEDDTGNQPFHEIEPYPVPIDPALLLDEIANIIRRFVILDPEQADAIALWVSHTYIIDNIDISPLLLIDSPEKGCGKTLLESLLSDISYRSLAASHASASALFRAVELWEPTIFFDEADTFFRDHHDLHNMINAGYKRGSFVLRSEAAGDSFTPRKFSVFSAKCIAGISLGKHLPDSTMSRGILIKMRRKLPHEKVERLRHADRSVLGEITSKLTRFTQDYSQRIKLARPVLPDELSDRDQDNWEPLFAIAECAGPEWLQRATGAALKLSSTNEASVSIGNQLLADIQHIFESGENSRKISTTELISALTKDEEGPWKTYNRGKEITPRQLAKLLGGYGIKSKTVRIKQGYTPKGYDADQFADAFARYLAHSPKLPQQHNDSPESQ